MPAINFESLWFRWYSKALFTDDPAVRQQYIKAALEVSQETLRKGGIQHDERKAIAAAIVELSLLEGDVSSHAA